MTEKNMIIRMTCHWKSIDKLYDKLIPICRKEARSEHRAMGVYSTIKKVNKELEIMKCRARADTREFKRLRTKRYNQQNEDLLADN